MPSFRWTYNTIIIEAEKKVILNIQNNQEKTQSAYEVNKVRLSERLKLLVKILT